MKNFITFLLIALAINAYSQKIIFRSNGSYKYFVGTSEPDTNWYKPGFDDSGWKQGNCSIGYGVKHDSTVIDTTTSVYLRIKFTVSNKDAIKAANFFADFDDGFVAYLNGNEITRINLGKPGEYIAHDRLTDRSHEAYLYRNYFEPNGFYLDDSLLSHCLVNGDNILSVQVHNDSVKGSDLFFNSILFDLTNEIYSFWTNYSYGSNFIYYNYYYRQYPLDSTKLPIVVINTDEFGLPVAHTRYVAHMGIINNGPGKLNRPTDTCTDYNGRITIEIKGNLSKDMPKKSFRIETQDSTGEQINVPLLGMPKDNDWVIYGPVFDKTLIRNELAFTIGRKLGYYEPRTRYCELIINGEFQGLYVFMEKIKRGVNRVNITKMTPDDNSGVELTGGYIVNLYLIEYPKSDEITAAQTNYINNYINNYYALLDSAKFLDPNVGYKKYIDDQTLLDYVIANELLKNCDSYSGSTYFYKDRDDKDGRIKYGPLWDNDLAFGDAPDEWQQAATYKGWQFNVTGYLRITKILRDTTFVNRFINKWHDLRTNGFLRDDSLSNLIDTLAGNIKDDQDLNYQVWPLIDKDFYYMWNFKNVCISTTYSGAMDNLHNWIAQRLTWIDDNIGSIYYPNNAKIISAGETGSNDKFDISPNPFSNYLNIEYNIVNPGIYSLQLCDLNGRIIYMVQNLNLHEGQDRYKLENKNLTGLPKGIYILNILRNNNIIQKEKIVKI